MPKIKNWKKIDSENHKYRPDGRATVRLQREPHPSGDGRKSLWSTHFVFNGESKETIVDSIESKSAAQQAGAEWMRDHPELDMESLGRGVLLDDDSPDNIEAIPPGGCLHYDSCSNMTPGGADSGNIICDSCLTEARAKEAGTRKETQSA